MTTPRPGRPDTTTTAKLDGSRLDELWDFGDPAGSAVRFRTELLSLGPDSTGYAELRTQIARALALQHLPDEADAELDAVQAAGPDNAQVLTRLQLERGRVHNSNGRPSEAVPLFSAAAASARAAGDDFLLVDALHMLAIADGDRSDEWTREALKVTETTADQRTKRWVGSLRNNFGWALHDRGNFSGALEQFERARTAHHAGGSAEQVRIAEWAVARAFRSLGRFDEALSIQLQLLAGEPDGYVEEELAEILLATGRELEARPHFAKAAELLEAEPWLDEPERTARLRDLGSAPAE